MTSITQSVPTGVYGFSGPGLILTIAAFFITFGLFALIAFIVIRSTNPMFLRNIQDNTGQYTGITVWRSLWVSWVIALIPAIIIAGLVFYINARTMKAVAGVAESALPLVAQAAPLLAL